MKHEKRYSIESLICWGRILQNFGRLRVLGPIEYAENVQNISLFPSQKLILRLLYGDPLDDGDVELLDSWRNPSDPDEYRPEVHLPSTSCKEVVLVCGMRSSKTFLASLIGSYETYRYLSLSDPWSHYGLPKRQPVFGMIASTSEITALDTVFAQLKPMIEGCAYFNAFRPQILKSSIFFPSHNLTIRVGASYSGALVGRTDLFVIFDELDQCPDTAGKLGGESVYRALSKGTATMNGLTMSLTSPLYDDSMSMRLLRGSEKDPSMLGLRLPTWMMNPTMPRNHPKLRSAYIKDREGAARDYGALPSAAISPFFKSRDKLDDALVGKNAFVGTQLSDDFGPVVGAPYVAAGDPSNVTDDFGFAFGHLEDKIIIDGVTLLSPDKRNEIEIDPEDVDKIFTSIADKVELSSVYFDTYNYPHTRMMLKDRNIGVYQNHVLMDEYLTLKHLVNSGKIVMPDNERLRQELHGLERIKNKVDHPSRGSKDMADAVCQVACVLASIPNESGPIAMPQLF